MKNKTLTILIYRTRIGDGTRFQAKLGRFGSEVEIAIRNLLSTMYFVNSVKCFAHTSKCIVATVEHYRRYS